ncbi:MAG: hypothetical protein JWN76_890 [Chitinophagaceae bacterium]|nr:hypothetical protein [Chitinophagaceae bacterium]
MEKIKLFILCVCFGLAANAQDPHFSQFFSSPLTLTPAYIGKFDGNIRVAGNYRNQWPTINRAYQTSTVSVDFPVLQNKIAYNDRWGAGIMAYTDKSANGAVSFNYASVGTAFHKGLDEDGYQQVGAGFQLTYAQMRIYTADLHFADQLTSLGFTNVTSEVFAGDNLKSQYIDLNGGFLYTGSTNDNNFFYGGVSGYHLNRPKTQFTGADYLMEPRVTIHGGGYFPISYNAKLHLSGLFSTQAGNNETVVGGAFEFTPGGSENQELPVSVYAGAWIRLQDALIPYAGLEFGTMRLGISYDVNTSQLKTASNSRGGIEISLIYISRSPDSKPIHCPKF